MERAGGQKFARAFLSVLYPHGTGRNARRLQCRNERRSIAESLRKISKEPTQKDQLTFGLYSVFGKSPALMAELVLYAKSAKGDVELGVDQAQGVSNFPCVSGFGGQLYDLFCLRFFFVTIHQQLVESFFSKYDTCTRKIDVSELDEVRTAQYSSLESKTISAVAPTPKQIREAGSRAQSDARAARTRAYNGAPKARDLRKRPLERGEADMLTLEGKKRGRTHVPAAPADN